MVVLDTISLLLLDSGSKLLGLKARQLIKKAYQRDELSVSAASFLQVSLWEKEERIRYAGDLKQWRLEMLGAGILEHPADGTIFMSSLSSGPISEKLFKDIILATAMKLGATLVTVDDLVALRYEDDNHQPTRRVHLNGIDAYPRWCCQGAGSD